MLFALVVAQAAALLLAAGVSHAATPLPKVKGPLRATASSYPFGAADHQRRPQRLGRSGYVEREYIVRGRANVYDWPASSGGAVVRTANAPYVTRVLVRRPRRSGRVSGTVWVEFLNPSNLFELNIGWALAHRQLMRDGDVWVGITAKPVAIEALKNFDARRYRSLSFANPPSLGNSANCTALQAALEKKPTREDAENGLAWDVYSQVGR